VVLGVNFITFVCDITAQSRLSCFVISLHRAGCLVLWYHCTEQAVLFCDIIAQSRLSCLKKLLCRH